MVDHATMSLTHPNIEEGSTVEQLLANLNGCLTNGRRQSTSPSIGPNDESAQSSSPEAADPNIDPAEAATLDAQKTIQKLAAQLGGFPFNQSFPMNNNFLAALQQQHMLGGVFPSEPCSSRQSPERLDDDGAGDNEDFENIQNGEPEDLSVGKIKKSPEADDSAGSVNGTPSCSFEEQFKQLYEISNEKERKEWLDDWFNFMKENGKTVTRIPIMAKHVLDLYELYRLVVKHGGLVEIINKKLWREITKGLMLPASITSAAFTLRTQYQKYLYDYECEKHGFSTHEDLMAAIESNKREGRRNPTSNGPNGQPGVGGMLGGGGMGHHGGHPMSPWGMPPLFGNFGSPFGFKTEDDGNPLANLSNAHHALAAAALDPQRHFEFLQRATAGRLAIPTSSNFRSGRSSVSSTASTPNNVNRNGKRPRPADTYPTNSQNGNNAASDSLPAKRPCTGSSTNMRITTKDNQMYVSMEVNGTMYQGMLFAVPAKTDGTSPPPNQSLNVSSSSGSAGETNALGGNIDMNAFSAIFNNNE
uniref:ARID domain-containing protein n=1 Tax=Panagrellus redivivus TaxID=6233 RepID=A0A7E4US55_PANRE